MKQECSSVIKVIAKDANNISYTVRYGLCFPVILVALLENPTIEYSLQSLCVCVCLHDIARNRSRNTKLDYIKVYENSSDEFDIELHRIKVTVEVQIFSPFTTIQTVRSYGSTLVQARNLILSMYVHLIIIYKSYECRHA